LLFGGYNKDTLSFNVEVTSMMASLMVIASASLIIPSTFSTTSGSKSIEHNENVLTLSHITAIILLILYLVYLYFQMVSHAHLFKAEEAGDKELGFWSASVVLIFATLGITVCSDNLVDSIDGVVQSLNISRPFIGLIIVPIVGNAGEYVAAVNASMKDNLNLAISLVVGATLQIALFVTPFLVIMGWIIDRRMTLEFDPFETTVFSLAVLVVNYLLQDGRTNYFAGALLIGTYVCIPPSPLYFLAILTDCLGQIYRDWRRVLRPSWQCWRYVVILRLSESLILISRWFKDALRFSRLDSRGLG